MASNGHKTPIGVNVKNTVLPATSPVKALVVVPLVRVAGELNIPPLPTLYTKEYEVALGMFVQSKAIELTDDAPQVMTGCF